MVWATAREQVKTVKKTAAPAPVTATLAFYRKYTEAMLRRYTQMAMEIARVPSLLGRELFRGKVTNYVVHGFDDVVIFVHDVEQCLKTLDLETGQIIERIGMQEYTLEETAAMMGLPLWTVNRRYGDALDAVTAIFLERRLLEPLILCQEAENTKNALSH
jgi:hypothetical protein